MFRFCCIAENTSVNTPRLKLKHVPKWDCRDRWWHLNTSSLQLSTEHKQEVASGFQPFKLIQSYSLSSIHRLGGGHETRGRSEHQVSNSDVYWLRQCVEEPVEWEELVYFELFIWVEKSWPTFLHQQGEVKHVLPQKRISSLIFRYEVFRLQS